MEVTIDVISSDSDTRAENIVGRIQFIMVCRDSKTDKAASIPKLVPSNSDLEIEFGRGGKRALLRKVGATLYYVYQDELLLLLVCMLLFLL
jgi:hypothetical protein